MSHAVPLSTPSLPFVPELNESERRQLQQRSAARRPRLRDELDVNLGFRVLRELDA